MVSELMQNNIISRSSRIKAAMNYDGNHSSKEWGTSVRFVNHVSYKSWVVLQLPSSLQQASKSTRSHMGYAYSNRIIGR